MMVYIYTHYTGAQECWDGTNEHQWVYNTAQQQQGHGEAHVWRVAVALAHISLHIHIDVVLIMR